MASGIDSEFYQFVVAAVYHADGLWGDATFDLYLRQLPEDVGYAICAGVDEALEAALSLGFGAETVDYLRGLDVFSGVSDTFFDSLGHMRFTGDVWVMAEGTPFFPREPILRITAPLVQCALLETALIQRMGFGVAVATRATRLVDAAGDKDVLDFSARRWPGPEAARAAARAAYIGGVTNTSNVSAAGRHAIEPISALAGAFLAVYRDERRALDAMRLHFPQGLQLVLPEEDPRGVMAAFKDLVGNVTTLRLGEPNLRSMARLFREALDKNGLRGVEILGSGGLDEYKIARLCASNAPVDRFAVGSALVKGVEGLQGQVSFRLAEMMRGTSMEPALGRGAAEFPGCKQVVRFPHKDVLCLEREAGVMARVGGVPLLHHVLRQGERVGSPAPLAVARGLRKAGVAHLPAEVRRLERPSPFPVEPSGALAELALG